jgi:hypothetical protein
MQMALGRYAFVAVLKQVFAFLGYAFLGVDRSWVAGINGPGKAAAYTQWLTTPIGVLGLVVHIYHMAHYLVPQDGGCFFGALPGEGQKVAAANGGEIVFYQHLTRLQRRNCHLLKSKGQAHAVEYGH